MEQLLSEPGGGQPSGATRGGAVPPPVQRSDSAAMMALLQRMAAGQDTLMSRIEALESRPPVTPAPTSGILDTEPLGQLSPADVALVAELRSARPGAASAPKAKAPAPPMPGPLPSGLEGDLAPRFLAAVEAIALRPPPAAQNPAPSDSKLFKLAGATGRVAQQVLNERFEEEPGSVVAEFEKQVRLLAPTTPGVGLMPGQEAPLPLQQVWRDHVPARDHHITARIGEALIDVYLNLRCGRTAHGMARIALLMAAMEQNVLDSRASNAWQQRAEHILGMPTCPLHLYTTPPKPDSDSKDKDKDKDKLGRQAQLCAPTRSTTADQCYRDNKGH